MRKSVIHIGNVFDILPTLAAESVNCVMTSPPYWGLRDYGSDGQLGLEPTPEEYVANLVAVFREVRRILRGDGTLWFNIGDTYTQSGRGGNPADSKYQKQATNVGSLMFGHKPPSGLKPKNLVGIPWRVAFALQADGWYLRSEIIWAKTNPMPESVKDRPTKAHEQVFLLAKSAKYWYDAEAIKERSSNTSHGAIVSGPGWKAMLTGNHSGPLGLIPESGTRNCRTVWVISTQPYKEAHFATFPEKLVEPCVLAGCPVGGTVLDPFCGSGTTGAVSCRLGRNFIGIELNPEYAEMAERRIAPHLTHF